MKSIKIILRDTCILAALMILSVFAISIIWSGVTEEIGLVLKLFGLALIIAVVNYLIDEYLSLSMAMYYVVKYFAITVLVMLFGFIAGWFYPTNFWMAFVYVGVVLILAYSIDSFRVKKDIEFINGKISDRGQRGL
ncbi:hypothetical protein SAMN04487770_12159 [Butyrivibrio sp. ob235]|uniref:hypothetical protein n=1 Tax=unclassified Butyrivibrio TaxID=2639466 RepID=UPI0003B750DE|nr:MULTISPECIES: hypothetical protein [unclassified Butyrivibrio]SEL94314.1 hypothetical protein SAMN04487770_12159 [Butyrivibrio sp. ob235]